MWHILHDKYRGMKKAVCSFYLGIVVLCEF